MWMLIHRCWNGHALRHGRFLLHHLQSFCKSNWCWNAHSHPIQLLCDLIHLLQSYSSDDLLFANCVCCGGYPGYMALLSRLPDCIICSSTSLQQQRDPPLVFSRLPNKVFLPCDAFPPPVSDALLPLDPRRQRVALSAPITSTSMYTVHRYEICSTVPLYRCKNPNP